MKTSNTSLLDVGPNKHSIIREDTDHDWKSAI